MVVVVVFDGDYGGDGSSCSVEGGIGMGIRIQEKE